MQQRQRLHLLALLALVPPLAACSWGDDEPAPESVSAVPGDDGSRLVASVTEIELGRLADGYALSVFGLSNTAGWSSAELRLRDGGPDAEGFLHFEFVAIPPDEPSLSPMAALPDARRVRADRFFTEGFLAPLAGLRIWTEAGASDVTFN